MGAERQSFHSMIQHLMQRGDHRDLHSQEEMLEYLTHMRRAEERY